MNSEPDAFIILRRLKIQNVNAISSPLTWGFPSITAILGFIHALGRKLGIDNNELKLGGVGIICHDFVPQIMQSNNRDAQFCLTRNPLQKDGSASAFAEEGRAHMEISLVIQAYGDDCNNNEQVLNYKAEIVLKQAQTLRLAGGSIFLDEERNYKNSEFVTTSKPQKILRQLMPGFVLINREDLLEKHTNELQKVNQHATALDALLEFSSLNIEPELHDLDADKVEWTIRKKPGWIIPIPVGYSAISELYPPGKVLNTRDQNYPFQFVESIYSLGQWISPHRIKDIDDIFWHYDVDTCNGFYRCINKPINTIQNLTLRSDIS